MGNKASVRKLPLNLFDIIIIIIVISIASGLIFIRMIGNDKADESASGTVEYTIELSSIFESTKGMIKPGDKIEDKIKKLYMGEVKSVEFYPATKEATDYETGNTVYREMPGYVSASVTLVADCRETESEIIVDGGYTVRIGNEISVLGPGYSGAGYVIGVKRGED